MTSPKLFDERTDGQGRDSEEQMARKALVVDEAVRERVGHLFEVGRGRVDRAARSPIAAALASAPKLLQSGKMPSQRHKRMACLGFRCVPDGVAVTKPAEVLWGWITPKSAISLST